MQKQKYIKWLGMFILAGLMSGCFIDFMRKENKDMILKGDKEWYVYKIVLKSPLGNVDIQSKETDQAQNTTQDNKDNLESVDMQTYPRTFIPKKGDSSMSFDIEENKIFGIGSCNNYFANFKLKRNELKITNVGSSRRMCHPPENMSYEMVFFRSLEGDFVVIQSKSNEIDADELRLEGKNAIFYLR